MQFIIACKPPCKTTWAASSWPTLIRDPSILERGGGEGRGGEGRGGGEGGRGDIYFLIVFTVRVYNWLHYCILIERVCLVQVHGLTEIVHPTVGEKDLGKDLTEDTKGSLTITTITPLLLSPLLHQSKEARERVLCCYLLRLPKGFDDGHYLIIQHLDHISCKKMKKMIKQKFFLANKNLQF